MAKLELVVGPSRSGKTTYAKNKTGYSFLCYDDLLYCAQWNWEVFKSTLINTLNANQLKDFILDGWFSTYNWNPKSVLELQKKTGREVSVTCFYAPIEGLLERTKCETRSDIITWYKRMAHFYRDELRNVEFTFRDSERTFSFTEFMHLIRPLMVTVSREEVMLFISQLESLPSYDRYYQTINLPYEITLPGYERTELAWQAIAEHVNFRGKTVLDAGCYHNFCGRAAEDSGALKVVGIDRDQRILDNAKRINEMSGYETELIHADLDEWVPKESFDIVMCLNAIHYANNPERVVRKLFSCGDLVIMEAAVNFKKTFNSIPTHKLIRELPSPRAELKRVLYFYERVADEKKGLKFWK